HASAQLDQDLSENPTLAFANANIGQAQAVSEPFTVAGLESDDNGAITFSDGTHNVVVNVINGVPVSTSVNLSGMTDGPITASLSVSDVAGNTFQATATAQLNQHSDEWTPAGNGNWSANHWSNGVPTAATNVLIDVAGTYTITISQPSVAQSL